MTDPFRELREPVQPVAPDPVFARRLRGRLERALNLPRGVVPVTTTVLEPETSVEPRPAAVPYLAVNDARAAIDWYVDVLGARLSADPIVMPDGRIGHCDLEVSGGHLYLSDAHPEIGVAAPRPGEASVSLMLPVEDADAVRDRAMAAGASGDRPPYDAYGSRNAWIVDPFGHRWGLHSPLPTRAAPLHQGDVGYVALWVPDAERAAVFYAGVVGWSYTGAHDGPTADGTTPSVGLRSIATDASNLFCCYVVDDVAAAIERVRAAGGEAGEPDGEPWGSTVLCTDDQGTQFALYEQAAGAGGERPPANGHGPGDLSYLTLEVVDSARARAFYGAVLGWEFTPGRIDDGWGVGGTTPMIGLAGGSERARAVPMWAVSDIAASVVQVRARGGTATDPERQPYGLMSECVDDQGSKFYLGQ